MPGNKNKRKNIKGIRDKRENMQGVRILGLCKFAPLFYARSKDSP